MGRVARQPIEFVDRQRALAAVAGDRFDASVERRHRDGHVGGMNGGAIRAGAEDAEAALEAAECRASGAGLALVAGHGRVVEIRAARALEQIAGGGGLVAQLARRAGQKGLRQHRIAPPDLQIGGQVAIAHLRADAQAALIRGGDRRERQAADVDEMSRSFDPDTHEVDQVRAAGDKLRVGPFCSGGGGSAGIGCALVSEVPHRSALPRGVADRRDDVGIGGAAAEIAAHALANFGIGQCEAPAGGICAGMAWPPASASRNMPTAEQICPGVQ